MRFPLASLAAALLVSTPAHARTLNFCVALGFKDSRSFCPLAGTLGARTRACNRGGESFATFFEFELWDRDDLSIQGEAHDRIGRFRTTGPGENCASFQWPDDGEDPDLFVVMLPVAQARGNTAAVRGLTWQDSPGGLLPAQAEGVSSINMPGGVRNNCRVGEYCRIGSGVLVPSTDSANMYNRIWGALDSAVRPLDVYGSEVNGTQDIDVLFDEGTANCNSQVACAVDRTNMRIGMLKGGDRIATTPAHEIGHILQMREFGQDDLRGCNGADWEMDGFYGDACATTEGWASYVGILGFWDPDVIDADPVYRDEFTVETGAPLRSNCASNRGSPLQVMRAFWDLDDADNSRPGPASACRVTETKNSSSVSILNTWDKFPDGYWVNREDFEPNDDGHAVNLWDYAWSAWGSGSNGWGSVANYQSLLWHNCLGAQDIVDQTSESVPPQSPCLGDGQ